MKTSKYDGAAFNEPRSHPWRTARANSTYRYYDFTTTPALIRTSLEDFVPWVRYPAIERFYGLLEWLNRGVSPLESNDCEFTGPERNDHAGVAKSHQCAGRVMLLFRALERNVAEGEVEGLSLLLHNELAQLDPTFEYGMIGTALAPARYLALARAGQPALGPQLMVSFWAWGDGESETMLHLERLLGNLWLGLRNVAQFAEIQG
jgi:hypothetical protein